MDAAPLLCPSCASSHGSDERFCPRCGMPLVPAGGEASVTERQERARKIDPQYTEGALVWVAGMLLEEGVPSLVRRAAGFDVPDFLAGGPREILVPTSGAPAARDILLDAGFADATATASVTPRPTRLLAGLLLGIALVAIVLFMATHTWD
jgi:hypothetical protein